MIAVQFNQNRCIAKFDKSDSYTSKALRLRVNPKGDFGNKNINNLEVQRNGNSHKSKLKIKASEYWRNVLRNQWLLVLQGIVIVIVILTITFGYEHKKDIADNSPVALWRSIIERLQETTIDMRTELQSCYNTEVNTQQKRRASILKRRRIFMNE
ncbi:PREDICTED: uncharacterized protein LOC108748418 isoform X2 [Trachymyrmex septentrionalis]|uniref:uncharacterized protein LOC108748418 isoform X2 n=1 Tax=Trachymyrmex septentrionalis TaxID=34720 RepID=UPI00084EF85A|nr:PREDICTED: uncharacterized protein LOC108748418 isoform X2 [Trachymyrmex septentrionalis]